MADCKSLAPTWEAVATDYANDRQVVVAKVDAESPDSKAAAEAEGVSGYPTIKWFPAGSKKSVPYEGSRDEADLLKYINEKASTHRVPGGELDAVAGTVASLDTLVAKIVGSGALADVAAEVNKEVKKLTSEAQKKSGEYYVRVLDKLSSNQSYATKELSRLEGILSKSELAVAKRDELQRKANVLRKFVKEATEKVEKAEEAKDEL